MSVLLSHHTNQFGVNGEIKIERVSDGKVSVRAEELYLTGALLVKKIYIGGVPLMDYFKQYIDTKVESALNKKQSMK